MSTPDEDAEEVKDKKFRTQVTIGSLGNERRIIELGELDQEQFQEVIRTVSSAFEVVRKSHALMLSGKDGVTTFANLDNVAFVEVHVR
jgi:hypothetical protein